MDRFAHRFSEELNRSYPGVRCVIATKSQLPLSESSGNFKSVRLVKFPLSYSDNDMWLSLIHMAETRYILVGRSLHTFYGKWINIERSIRLLGSKYLLLKLEHIIMTHVTNNI